MSPRSLSKVRSAAREVVPRLSVILVALLAAPAVPAADDLDRFAAMGGELERDEKAPGRPARLAAIGPAFKGSIRAGLDLLPTRIGAVTFEGGSLKAEDLAGLDHIRELGWLTFYGVAFAEGALKNMPSHADVNTIVMGGALTDQQLRQLNDFARLNVLHLEDSSVTDQQVALLRLPELISLTLDGARITESVAAALVGCPKLSFIALTGTAISDKTLQALTARTTPLTALYLDGTSVGDAGLSHLAGARELISLSLGGTRITDAGLAHLHNCTNFTSLDFSHTKITEKGLGQLPPLKKLESLDLSETNVSGAVFDILKSMDGLTKLNLSACPKISRRALDEFKKARPNVDVSFRAKPPFVGAH